MKKCKYQILIHSFKRCMSKQWTLLQKTNLLSVPSFWKQGVPKCNNFLFGDTMLIANPYSYLSTNVFMMFRLLARHSHKQGFLAIIVVLNVALSLPICDVEATKRLWHPIFRTRLICQRGGWPFHCHRSRRCSRLLFMIYRGGWPFHGYR